jgi:dihydroflavonol-4-reductase
VRVLVTGATGLVGGAVVQELKARGLSVRALVRPSSDLSNLGATGAGEVELAEGDVLDRPSVERALAGCQAVIHAAGIASFGRETRQRLFAVNAGGVEVVLGAALAAGVERAVLTSSAAVLGGSAVPHVADEDTTSSADTLDIDFFVSKLRGEEVGLDLAARGLPLVIVRPAYVLGPGDLYRSSASTVLALARGRIPAYVQGGASFCDVRDVARGHVEALLRGQSGETYLLGGQNLTMDEFVGRTCRLAGVKAPLRLPYAVAVAATRAMQLAARLGAPAPAVTLDLLRASRLYTFVTSARAQRELGYTIRPFEDSVRDTLRWYVARGALAPATPELKALAAGTPPSGPQAPTSSPG